jgi:hypothetical protein
MNPLVFGILIVIKPNIAIMLRKCIGFLILLGFWKGSAGNETPIKVYKPQAFVCTLSSIKQGQKRGTCSRTMFQAHLFVPKHLALSVQMKGTDSDHTEVPSVREK